MEGLFLVLDRQDGVDCQGMPSLSQYWVLVVCLVVSLLATNTQYLLVYECHVLFDILHSFGKLSHDISGDQALRLPPHLATVPEKLRRHEPIFPLHNRTRRRRKHACGKRAGIHVVIAKKKVWAQRKSFRVAAAAWIDDMDLTYRLRWIQLVCLAELQPDQLFFPCWRGVWR